MIFIVACTLLIIAVATKRGAGQKSTRNTVVVMLLALIVTILAINCFKTSMAKHGAEETDNINILQALNSIKNSPIQSELPDDLTGQIVIYYRFGCESCEIVWPELNRATQNQNVYFVSSRSDDGQALLEKYPVSEVPTGIYITRDGLFYAEKLYYYDQDKNIVFDQDGLDRLFNFQKNNY